MKNKKKNKEKGFVILIAIVVSALLVSLGMFITNVAYKELQLSTSIKESQKAFYVADTVIECALNFDNNGDTFIINQPDYEDAARGDVKFKCGGIEFKPDKIYKLTKPSCTTTTSIDPVTGASVDIETCDPTDMGNATSIYYVSFADDTSSDGELSELEIKSQKEKPYAKLIVEKINGGKETVLTAYGHNKYLGSGIVERAIKVTY